MAASNVREQSAPDLVDETLLGGEDDEEAGATMSLVDHLEELRRRLIFCVIAVVVLTILSFVFWQQIFGFLLTPLPAAVNRIDPLNLHHAGSQTRLVVTDIGGPFLIALKVSLAMGIALASPVVLYELWGFLSPALTRKERRYALPFTGLGVGLFIAGLVVGFVVLRYPVDWLVSFGSSRFDLLLTADSYFTFIAYFLLAFGIVFELPLVITFLGVVGIVNSKMLIEKQMYILFGLWFAACFITPGADPYSPVIIGAAFTILFYLSVLLLRVLRK
ncbi:MAG TPA: twin-arginine translocase subunit TatC [Ktedonobacterales bacterium]|nr:twin-arginine translocase subunit TatC [Ktedonobacterales bacterium]